MIYLTLGAHAQRGLQYLVRTVESGDNKEYSIQIESENIPYSVQTFQIELAWEIHFDFKNFHNGCF